jgi:hypothetical protein
VLGVKPSVASAGSDLDLDKAFATVMQPTGPAIGACVITDQSSCDFLARERSARMVARGPHLRQCAFSAELHYQGPPRRKNETLGAAARYGLTCVDDATAVTG